jgi:glycosyltransferase involved in cell wall biosynthesis
MDSDNSLLSHQAEAVINLSVFFGRITVITGQLGVFSAPVNVKVIDSRWVSGKPWSSLFRFLRIVLPIISRRKVTSVFSHMTDVHAAAIAPFARCLRIKHYLWYAHTYSSVYLKWSSLWVNGIVTSTAGSCPIKSPRVIPIGQAIDPELFTPNVHISSNIRRLLHVGRFDKRKQIDLLIRQAQKIRETNVEVTLTLIGSPANEESKSWSKKIIAESQNMVNQGWITFKPAISRSELGKLLIEFDAFFHGYVGSLDKTLVESTMAKLPVLSINPEYLKIFGAWTNSEDSDLTEQYHAIVALSEEQLDTELERRRNIAISEHSSKQWTTKLAQLLGSNSIKK